MKVPSLIQIFCQFLLFLVIFRVLYVLFWNLERLKVLSLDTTWIFQPDCFSVKSLSVLFLFYSTNAFEKNRWNSNTRFRGNLIANPEARKEMTTMTLVNLFVLSQQPIAFFIALTTLQIRRDDSQTLRRCKLYA